VFLSPNPRAITVQSIITTPEALPLHPRLLVQAFLSPSPRAIMAPGVQFMTTTLADLLLYPHPMAQAFLSPSPRVITDPGVQSITTPVTLLRCPRPLVQVFLNLTLRAITDLENQSISTNLAILPRRRLMMARRRQAFLQFQFPPLHRPLMIWDQLRILLSPLATTTTILEFPRLLWMLNWE
jgi:hypothetical protein